MLWSLRRFSGSEVAEQRMKIIKFYEAYGEKATKEAFGASSEVISRWRKRLKESGGSLSALIPHSTRPHRVSCSDGSPKIIDFIKELRDKNMDKNMGTQACVPFFFFLYKPQKIM